MAKNAAKEAQLGALHAKLTTIFTKVLKKYELALEVVESIDLNDTTDEIAAKILEATEPNPTMLTVITKFLKDNDIGMDTAELNELSITERKLAERREARKRKGLSLDNVSHLDS